MSEASEIQKMVFSEGDEEYEIFIAAKDVALDTDEDSESDGRPGRGGGIRRENITRLSTEQMQRTTRMIRGFTLYTVNAFKQFGAAKVEEVNFSFGITIGGKAGIPYISEGSAESNVTISVKCTFPDHESTSTPDDGSNSAS